MLQLAWFVSAAYVGLLLTPAEAQTQAPEVEFAGRSVSVNLMRMDHRSFVAWPGGDVRLTTRTITINPGVNIPGIPAASGIAPDVGAFTLVYELNPNVRVLDAIATGTKLVIPQVTGGQALREQLASGCLIVLSVDPKLHAQLGEKAAVLRQMAARLSEAPQQESANRTASVRPVSDIVDWFEHIRDSGLRRKGPPMTRDTLSDLIQEAESLQSILQRAIEGHPLTPPDHDQIEAIHRDLQREIKRYDDIMSGGIPAPDSGRIYPVTVNIIGSDPALIGRLRVYYALNGLFRRPPGPRVASKPFPELGSGRSVSVDAKNYRFWAAPDGEPGNMATPDVLLEVDPTQSPKERRVQLLLGGEIRKGPERP